MRLWDVPLSTFHGAIVDLNLDFRQRYRKASLRHVGGVLILSFSWREIF